MSVMMRSPGVAGSGVRGAIALVCIALTCGACTNPPTELEAIKAAMCACETEACAVEVVKRMGANAKAIREEAGKPGNEAAVRKLEAEINACLNKVRANAPDNAESSDTVADDMARATVRALQVGDLELLWGDAVPADAELAAEIENSHALLGRDFPDLLRDLDREGIERARIEFVRADNVDDDNFTPLGSADVVFRSGSKLYYVNVTWVTSGGDAFPLGTSTWFKPVGGSAELE